MRSTEARAIGELAGRTLAGAGTMVRDLHMAVSGRTFSAVGPGGAPVRLVHDGVAEALYGGVRTALDFVAATLSRRPGDPLGAILGDLLVRVPSAAGEGRRRKVGFAIEDGHHVGGVTHFDLLNHPAVYDQIRAWIER